MANTMMLQFGSNPNGNNIDPEKNDDVDRERPGHAPEPSNDNAIDPNAKPASWFRGSAAAETFGKDYVEKKAAASCKK